MLRIVVAMLALLPSLALGLPFWGAKQSSPPTTPPKALQPGEFVWTPGIAPEGPIGVVVSLDDQLAFVYRNGLEIGVATVSSGKQGHDTPTGVFTILQKDRDHHSSKYNNASMPYTQRLTWDGVALHAGGLPGYPSSHGCVHLPSVFAEELFKVSPMGMTVVVVNQRTAPTAVVHPAAVTPVLASTGEAQVEPRLAEEETFRWEPEKSPTGPVSLVMSGADQRVIALRNGVEIGRAKLKVTDPMQPLGAHAFIVAQGEGNGQSVIVAGAPARNWVAVSMPGYAGAEGTDLASVVGGRVRMPDAFGQKVYPLLVPGSTLVILDAPILAQNTGLEMTVLANGAEVSKEP